MELWKQHQDMIMQVPIERDPSSELPFTKLIELWVKLQLVDPQDVEGIEGMTLKSKRSAVNVCPGVHLYFAWPLSQAVEMDEAGRFSSEVKDRLGQAFATWGQELR